MKILILLLLLLASACSEQATQEDVQDNVETSNQQTTTENVAGEKEIIPEVKIVDTKTDLKDSINTDFSVYKRMEKNNPVLVFKFDSENLNREPVNVDPKLWKAFIYFAKKEVTSLTLCEFGSEDQAWHGSYCLNQNVLDKNYFNQSIWIIYTKQPDSKIYDNSILDIIRFEDTHTFKTVIPKE
ncbi:MAG TPA: hypothetical protein VJB94_02800 [Candidatus Nanoarchaeia archaeon]|nr:hypothetical protein [Candidatus Nanoarchaeia archaeon]